MPAAAQTVWNRPEVGVHDHPDGADVAERRDAADREAGQLVGLAGGRPADVALAGDGGEPGEVDAVRAGHEADDRLERAVVARRDEDERLDDLAELGADAPRGVGGRVGGLVEDR